jgi:hypothetical protein
MRGGSHGRVVFLLRAAIVLGGLMLRPLTASAAPVLLGDSVQGELLGPSVATQFTSPAVVGAGVEFTGGVVKTNSKAFWNVWVDIGASSFTIGWRHIAVLDVDFNPEVAIGLSLSGLDFTPAGTITGVTRTGYSCSPIGGSSACNGAAPIDPLLTFTDNAINLGFGLVRSGETYTFDIAVSEPTATPVPEPGSLALLGTGFATFIARRYRRRSEAECVVIATGETQARHCASSAAAMAPSC